MVTCWLYLIDGKDTIAVNLATGTGASVREVIETVRRVTGKQFAVRESDRREGDPPELVAAVDRARERLGWSAVESDLENIVRTAWKWTERRSR